jgi:beta-phosphoglucomutase family hydrolase
MGIRACLFDLDGVLTKTATEHAAAWKETFDGELRRRAAESDERFVPFDAVADYDRYVDGKPRLEGVRSFLASRGVDLPEGTANDPPTAETVFGIGNRKNAIVLRMFRDHGVHAYAGSVKYARTVGRAGLRSAVVSSSTNCGEILRRAGVEDLVDGWVDGNVADREQLKGKPEPDTFLAGARLLGVEPGQAAVFEDAVAGVTAGRAGGFGFVVGVDRVGHADALREHGADIVVSDLADLLDDP